MPLVLFIDALPYSYLQKTESKWKNNYHISKLVPNIGYSSNLHWQLFCNQYPDELGFFTDWNFVKESNKLVNLFATLLRPIEIFHTGSILVKKVMDRYIFKKNTFVNIPFQFRKFFSNNPKYLFFDSNLTREQDVFNDYEIILQDENNKSFKDMLLAFDLIYKKNDKIFCAFSFADYLGHKLARTKKYDHIIDEHMELLCEKIDNYKMLYPNDEVLIVSDHGMSSVTQKIKIDLKSYFGKESKKKYIAFKDSAIMRVFITDDSYLNSISEYLNSLNYGHLLTENERLIYGVTNRKFGELIYILNEGFVFQDSWFSQSLKRTTAEFGMHGFFSQSDDHSGVLITKNKLIDNQNSISYSQAFYLIERVMKRNDK